MVEELSMNSVWYRIIRIMIALVLMWSLRLLSGPELPTLKREIRVKPGDAIHLRIYDGFILSENVSLKQLQDSTKIVDGEGNIELAALGKVHVANMSVKEVGEILDSKFKQFIDQPRSAPTHMARINLRGTFIKPGLYRVDLRTSFWEVVKTGGGLQSFDLAGFYIERQGEAIYRDFETAFYQGTSLYELGLESGDSIVAPRINRLTVQTVMRYFGWGLQFLTFYVTLLNYRR
jgi:hypothetical protein